MAGKSLPLHALTSGITSTWLLQANGYDENQILALLTANPTAILGKEDQFGKLEEGMDANFLVADGIPGLEITDVEDIQRVYFRGKLVVDRMFG